MSEIYPGQHWPPQPGDLHHVEVAESESHAILSPDGTASYVCPDPELPTNLQHLGWAGLHTFLELYPNATVQVAGGAVPPGALPQLLGCLRKNRGGVVASEPKMRWPERIAEVLKPGRKYARHYTYADLGEKFPDVSKRSLRTYVDRAKKAGLVVAEPWGPIKVTFRRADAPVDEQTQALVESWNYSTYHNGWSHSTRLTLTVTDAERELGLTPTTLHAWFVNHDLHVVLPKRGKYRYAFPKLLEYYLEQTSSAEVDRLPARPEGYISLGQAQSITEGCGSQLWNAVRRGEVRAVKVGLAWFYSCVDVERFAAHLKNTPLPGYEGILDRCRSVGAEATACTDWLRRNGYQVRQFRRPDKQVGNYALSGDLDIWEAGYLADRNRALSMAQAREVRRRREEGVPLLAREFAVDNNTIRQILLGNTYRETELDRVA